MLHGFEACRESTMRHRIHSFQRQNFGFATFTESFCVCLPLALELGEFISMFITFLNHQPTLIWKGSFQWNNKWKNQQELGIEKFPPCLYVTIEIEMLIGTVFPQRSSRYFPGHVSFHSTSFPFRCLMNGKLNEMENIFSPFSRAGITYESEFF